MPEKKAASWFAPIAKIARPSGVAWRTTPKTTASARKIATEYEMCVCGIGTTPMFARPCGNPLIVSVGRIPCAMPR